MCRSHFLVAFLFVGTDFNCFLKSIRRSIPMTVAVKLTSTRRCMTCSFFVTFFYAFIKREIWRCAPRSLCRAVRASPGLGRGSERRGPHYTRDLISVLIQRGLIQISNLTGRINYRCVTITYCYRCAVWAGRAGAERGGGETSRRVMWGWMDYGILIITAALTAGRYDHACASILLRIVRRHLFIGNKKIELCFFSWSRSIQWTGAHLTCY